VDPAHSLGAWFGLRNIKRSGRRIDADHLEPSISEKQRERPRPASDVQHPVGTELLSDVDVHLKIAAVGIEGVVDGDEARILKVCVGHATDPKPRTSYKLCYSGGMADPITFRPDEDAQRALDALTADGTAVSTAVRSALIDAATSLARERLRSEAEAIASHPQDRAEAAQVLKAMETLRAW